MKPSILQESEDILGVDFNNSEIQRDDRELFVGFGAMQLINRNNLTGTFGVQKFKSEVRGFYINVLNYIQKKFPLHDSIIKNAVVIDPLKRQEASLNSLLEVVGQLPEYVAPLDSREALCREFCCYQAANPSELLSMIPLTA